MRCDVMYQKIPVTLSAMLISNSVALLEANCIHDETPVLQTEQTKIINVLLHL